ncbi:MAG: MFS transporter [Streptosporangiaceae bacterium]
MSAEAPADGPADQGTRLVRDRSFQLFWLAQTVSLAGSAVTWVVLPLLMYQRSGSALDTSLLATTEAIPYVVLGPLAGAVSDRVRRQPFLVVFDVLSAAAIAVIPVSGALGMLSVPVIFAVAFGAGICFVWYDAALFGAVPALVGTAGLVRANPLLQGGATAASLAGPAIGATLATAIGAAPALSLDAASFAVSAALISLIRRPLQPARTGQAGHPGRDRGRRLGTEIAAGFRFLRAEHVIRALTGISLAVSVAGGAVFGLLVIYATQALGLSARSPLIGLLYTAMAAGGLGAATYASVAGRRLGPLRAALWALTATPVALAAVALVNDVAAALALLVIWSATYSGVTINAITARQVRIPGQLQGRVNTTARLLGWGLGWPAGAAAGGVLAASLGVRTTYIIVAAGLAIMAIVSWLSPLQSQADHRREATISPES